MARAVTGLGETTLIWTFLMDGGEVIPPGTGRVDVTVSWDVDATSSFDASLWAKPADAANRSFVADVDSGETVRIDVGANATDPPHVRLSGWEFTVMGNATGDGRPMRFVGDLSMDIVAIRGDYPLESSSHPNLWDGRDEIPLFEHERSFDGYAETAAVNARPNPEDQLHRPDDAVLVPPETSEVVVRIVFDAPADTRMRLMFHGADAREWTNVTPDSETGNERTYRLDATGLGDSPFAAQSSWRFLTTAETGVDGAATTLYGTYRLSATAFR